MRATLRKIKSITVDEYSVLAVLLILNAFFTYFLMMHKFDPRDYSGFIDAAWRISRGQKIYQDFFYHAGPVFPYTLAFFISLLGFGKIAIYAHLITISTLAILLTYLCLRNRINSWLTLLAVLSATTGFYWNYPYPHYTHDAVFWGLIGFWILWTQIPFRNAEHAFGGGLLCGFLFVISYMTKNVVGIPYGMIYLIALSVANHRRHSFAGFFSGTFIAILLIGLVIGGYQEYLYNTSRYLQNMTWRLNRFLDPREYFHNFYWPAVLIVSASVLPFYKKLSLPLVLFFGSAFVAVMTLITGSVGMLTNNGLLGLCVGMGFLLLKDVENLTTNFKWVLPQKIARTLLITLLIFQIIYTTSFCTAIACQKFRKKIGKTIFFDYLMAHSYELKTKALEGWVTPLDFGSLLDVMTEYVEKNVPREDSLWAVSPWEIMYGLTGRDSFRVMPFQLLEKEIPLRGRQYDMVRDNLIKHPPKWIITHFYPPPVPEFANEYLMDLKLSIYLKKNYHVEKKWIVGVILHKNE